MRKHNKFRNFFPVSISIFEKFHNLLSNMDPHMIPKSRTLVLTYYFPKNYHLYIQTPSENTPSNNPLRTHQQSPTAQLSPLGRTHHRQKTTSRFLSLMAKPRTPFPASRYNTPLARGGAKDAEGRGCSLSPRTGG